MVMEEVNLYFILVMTNLEVKKKYFFSKIPLIPILNLIIYPNEYFAPNFILFIKHFLKI
jgi:hypothetical protein